MEIQKAKGNENILKTKEVKNKGKEHRTTEKQSKNRNVFKKIKYVMEHGDPKILKKEKKKKKTKTTPNKKRKRNPKKTTKTPTLEPTTE